MQGRGDANHARVHMRPPSTPSTHTLGHGSIAVVASRALAGVIRRGGGYRACHPHPTGQSPTSKQPPAHLLPPPSAPALHAPRHLAARRTRATHPHAQQLAQPLVRRQAGRLRRAGSMAAVQTREPRWSKSGHAIARPSTLGTGAGLRQGASAWAAVASGNKVSTWAAPASGNRASAWTAPASGNRGNASLPPPALSHLRNGPPFSRLKKTPPACRLAGTGGLQAFFASTRPATVATSPTAHTCRSLPPCWHRRVASTPCKRTINSCDCTHVWLCCSERASSPIWSCSCTGRGPSSGSSGPLACFHLLHPMHLSR